MKLRVTPIYGWGWFDQAGTVEVPAPFELSANIVDPGNPFYSALGQCRADQHPLSGLWIFLSQRHVSNDGYYNLRAFQKENPNPTLDAHVISGYAQAEIISD